MKDGAVYNPNDFFESLQFGDDFNPFGLFSGLFVPEVLAQSTELSPGSKLVYGRLARYAGRDGECFPAIETLGKEVGLGERQTRRYLAELEEFGLIRSIRRGSTSNAYRFRWHPIFRSIRVRFDRSDVSGRDRSDVSDQSGQICPPKRVIEESHLETAAVAAVPPYLLTHEEWPLTSLAIQGRFQSVDSIFVMRLVQDSVQAAISAGLDPAELTDRRLCQIVNDSIHEDFARPGKTAGLLLKTVPQIIRNRAQAHQKQVKQ